LSTSLEGTPEPRLCLILCSLLHQHQNASLHIYQLYRQIKGGVICNWLEWSGFVVSLVGTGGWQMYGFGVTTRTSWSLLAGIPRAETYLYSITFLFWEIIIW